MTTRTRFAFALIVLAFAFSAIGWSQETQTADINAYRQSPEHYFRLMFRVLDVSPESKVVASKSYNTIIASGPKSQETSSIRTGDRIPVATGSYGSNTNSSLVNTQFQYIDIGTKIDATRAAVIDQTLRLHVTANISSLSTPVTLGTVREPVIRQTSWDSNVTVPIGKATLIFSSDDSSDKGKMELELTATPIAQ